MTRIGRLTERVRYEIRRHRQPPPEPVWWYCYRCNLRINPALVPSAWLREWKRGPGGESYCPKCAPVEVET